MSTPTRDELFTSCQNLSKKLAKRFNIPGHEPEDTQQEAFLALWKATESYDPGRGTAFATHVYQCVNNHLINVYNRETSRRETLTLDFQSATRRTGGRGADRAGTDLTEDAGPTHKGDMHAFEDIVHLLPSREMDPAEEAELNEMIERVGKLVEGLRGSEAAAVRGLMDGETLETVAAEAGVSKQAIHKARNKAISRLREDLL